MITPSFSLTATERVLPKLALDFTTAILDPRVTFTRTTDATHPATYTNNSGVITAATNNQPRFDYDPVTLVCKGLLIEESRANICLYSEQFNAASWGVVSASVSPNQTTAPDGTLTADKLISDNGVAGSIRQGITISTVTYTSSIYAKAAEFSWFYLSRNGSGAYFNLGTGAVGTVTAGYTASITPVGNQWYRCSITWTEATGGSQYAVRLYATNTNGSITNGDGTSGVYIWGQQLEAGAFATSYIPTTSAALTRNADVATMTGTNFSSWWNNSEGAFKVQAQCLNAAQATTFHIISANDGTGTNETRLTFNSGLMYGVVASGGSNVAVLSTAITAANVNKEVLAYKVDSFASSVNGAAPATDSAGAVPVSLNTLIFGASSTNTFYLNGWIGKVFYYPQRLINAETSAFSK